MPALLMYYFFSIGAALLLHSILYALDVTNFSGLEMPIPVFIIITSILWPLTLALFIIVGSGMGYFAGLKALRKKVQKFKRDRAERIRIGNEVVGQEVEVVARVRR